MVSDYEKKVITKVFQKHGMDLEKVEKHTGEEVKNDGKLDSQYKQVKKKQTVVQNTSK